MALGLFLKFDCTQNWKIELSKLMQHEEYCQIECTQFDEYLSPYTLYNFCLDLCKKNVEFYIS